MTNRAPRIRILLALLLLIASWWFARGTPWILINLGLSWVWLWAAIGAVTSTPQRELSLRFALTTISLVLIVVVLEIPAILGVVDYRLVFRNRIASPWQNPAYRPDSDLLYRRPAHFAVSGETFGDITYLLDVPDARPYPFDLRLDANGFRNPADLSQADVALLGDSFIEAGLISDADFIATRLGAQRGETVASLGNVGYGPRQQFVLLRDYAIPLAPHTIVWLFFEGNDLQNIPTYDAMRRDPRRAPGEVSWLDRSFTHNALERVVNLVGHTGPPATRRSGLIPTADGEQRAYFLYATPPIQPHHEAAMVKLAGILDEASRLAEREGIRLLVAFVPVKYRVYHDRLSQPGPVTADWTLNDMPVRMESLVRGVSPRIGFVDLTPALTAALAEGTPPYFPDDSHWNAVGHRTAAIAIDAAIRRLDESSTRQFDADSGKAGLTR
ncbi:MAG: hypothetical protein L0271_14875 [Gemmatimonadetes bacterium]|nr:hypothetical protein [Gemmatimonadota bacterium]